MSHTSDVGKLSTAPAAPIQPSAPVQTAAELGGMPIQLETERVVRSGRTDAGKAFEDFDARPLDMDMTWSLQPSAQKSSERAAAASERVMDHLASGHSGADTLAHLEELTNETAHDLEVIAEMNMISAEISSAARTSRFIFGEIEKLKETLSDLRTAHMTDASKLLDALRSADLDDKGGEDLRRQVDQVTADIKDTLNAVKFAIFKGHLSDLHEVTAGMITISPDGDVDVEMVDTPMSVKLSDKSPSSFIETSGQARLSGDMEMIEGVPVASRAAADWPGMDLSFALPDGTSHSTLGATDGLSGSVQSLLALAGSKTAATVLSSVLHSGEIGELAHRFGTSDGHEVNFVPQSGSPAPADARIHVSRDRDGNFQVDVNWQLTSDHVVRDDGRDISLGVAKSADGNVGLQISMTGSFVISGEEAQNGSLSILSGGSFSHRIFGTA